MTAKELEKLLTSEIPITKQMGIRDLQITDGKLSLTLPIQPNVNHKQTMFGGSLYSSGAVACYGLFLSGLREHAITTNNIVISEGQMKYMAPVDQDARIEAQWNSDKERTQFFAALGAKKKARVLMRAQVFIANKLCAEFSGQFVALV